MQDRNILITGGTDGIGKATAHQLAKMSARLLLVGRNRDKGEAAISDIIRSSGSETVIFLQADLSLMREVRQAAKHIRQMFDRLDVLVHCAGGVFPPQRTLTDEGVEMSFAVQYLARFVLANDLLDLLHAAPAPQVVSIAGGGTTSSRIDFDNLNGEKNYSAFGAVAKAGVTNDALTLEQIARYPGITFYNYGPGLVRTAVVHRNMPLARLIINTLGRFVSRAPEQAANDIVTLLTGEYPGGLYKYGRSPKRNTPSSTVSDAAARARLWNYSETLVDNLYSNNSGVKL